MSKYPKINGVFKRYTKEDKQEGNIPEGKEWGEFIDGEWSQPEFELLKDVVWQWTEKVDGMNCRIIIEPNTWDIKLKGKTDNAEIPKPLAEWFEKWLDGYEENAIDMFESGVEVVLYGEGVGAKIQKGKHGFKDYEVILFDIRIGKYWLKKEHVKSIAEELGLRSVEVIEESTLQGAIDNMKERASKGEERLSIYGEWKMEGMVGCPKYELLDRTGTRIVTKLKYTDFRPKTRK
jgi:hypothetical protein